jgi:hypothetical protein
MYDLQMPQLGDSMVDQNGMPMSPLAQYQLRSQFLGGQDPMNGANLGNFQLQQPQLKPTTPNSMSPMQKMGIAGMVGDTMGGIMGGNAAKGIGGTIDMMQGPMSQTLARAQQTAQGPGLDPQMLQRASQRASSNGGAYGGFYPGLG